MDAIAKSGLDPTAVEHFVHGTTVVINALTERKGASTAVVTTEGCRDVLEIGRANRPDIYNLQVPQATIRSFPAHRRFEVTERTNYKGEVVTPLDIERMSTRWLSGSRRSGVEAVAVSLPSFLRQSRARAGVRGPVAARTVYRTC